MSILNFFCKTHKIQFLCYNVCVIIIINYKVLINQILYYLQTIKLFAINKIYYFLGRTMKFNLNSEWQQLLAPQLKDSNFLQFKKWLENEYATKTIYPQWQNIFAALNAVQLKDVKIVIIGQDPYHQPNQAHGLSFSVQNDVKLPPSLRNIFKELQSSVGGSLRKDGNLTDWAEQGVLLLNAVLTVQESMPASHEKLLQWQKITKRVVELVSEQNNDVVFMLWGGFAKKFGSVVDSQKHLVLTANHPSPMSANRGGWFGNNCFMLANNFLTDKAKKPINWVK